MAVEVYRGGVTAKQWTKTGRDVHMHLSKGRVALRFTMPSKGGGDTEVSVEVLSNHFEEFARLMMKAAPKSATHAFGVALQELE